MNLKSIQDKSMQTLIKNWGVENPSNSRELLQKRIESFKSSSFKDTFKLTSLKRYGVEHPWKNKEIHSKAISVSVNRILKY
jgi:hypothetical protein